MALYHFSEEPDITRFEPRPPVARPEVEPLVWAVSLEYAWTYLFPRDCPRVLLWPTPTSTPEDRIRWLGSHDTRVACIEWGWLRAMQSTALYRYTLPPETFAPLESEDTAWMFVSREPVEPLKVEPVGDLLEALGESGIEVRLMPTLAPLYGAWESTIHFSGIRLRNAKGWPQK